MRRNVAGWFVLVVSLLVRVPMAFAAPKIVVESATLHVAPTGKMGSAFMVITNEGDETDKLVACGIKDRPGVRGEVHNVEQGKMYQVKFVEIGAGKTVLLRKGEYHLMFFDMTEPLAERTTLNLQFEKSGTVEVDAVVRVAEAGMKHGEGGMKHEGMGEMKHGEGGMKHGEDPMKGMKH